ncbi:uncharacterized protein LOC135119574 isoform X2 [Zophobas morio]|uniref:uncharacterized protein LOC135119574 isoform X2 n=1 Tax=Zophobas morio TaxID=2755281 RepID=UPI003083E825
MTKVTYKENRKIGISEVYYIHRKEHFTTNAAYEKVNILSEFCKLSCTEGIMMEVLGPEQEVLLDFSSFTKFFEKLVNFLSHHYACVGMQESAKQLNFSYQTDNLTTTFTIKNNVFRFSVDTWGVTIISCDFLVKSESKVLSEWFFYKYCFMYGSLLLEDFHSFCCILGLPMCAIKALIPALELELRLPHSISLLTSKPSYFTKNSESLYNFSHIFYENDKIYVWTRFTLHTSFFFLLIFDINSNVVENCSQLEQSLKFFF